MRKLQRLMVMADGTTYRRHQCPACSHIFASVQRVLSQAVAEALLDQLEAPTTSFSLPPEQRAPRSTDGTERQAS